MKRVLLSAVLCLFCLPLFAQEPAKYSAFVGAGLNAEGQLKPAGAAGLLTALTPKTISFTGLSIRGITEDQPVTSVVQGLLYKVQDTDKLDVYASGNGGVAQSVDVVSGDFSAGGVVAYRLSESVELFLGLAARVAPAAGGVSPSILLGLHLGKE
jgi:hypothetical protein